MTLVLNESVVLAKTRSQDLKSVLKLNCWGCGIKDVSLVRQLINVEVIGLSCNEITTLEDFAYCKKLKKLILRSNQIKNIAEVAHLQKLPNLTCLWLGDNPCVESTYNYRKVVLKALPQLEVLDDQPVTREELQEIEELGNEIYEEIPYESSSSHGSGPPSSHATSGAGGSGKVSQTEVQPTPQQQQQQPQQPQHDHQPLSSQYEQSFNEMNAFQPTNSLGDMNETISSNSQYQMNESTPMGNRNSRVHQLQSQGSISALNGSNHQLSAWSAMSNLNLNNNNNNNNTGINMLPKGGKSRNANILSAVLCLVKELDYVSCEVVKTALHCRMEETSQ